MATTSPDGLYSPDEDTPVDFVADWAASMSSVQTALTNRATKSGTTAQRNAATGVREGTLWYDTTTGITYRYSSGAWVAITDSNLLETVDVSSGIQSGYTGSATLHRRGKHVALYMSISGSGSASLGPPTSSNFAMSIPSGYRPISAVTTAGRTVQSGQGFGMGLVHITTGGNVNFTGHRNGDTQIIAGLTYMLP